MKRIICFHKPEEPNGYLSNWYSCDFQVSQVYYTSMEQYMMYQKALLFNDIDIADRILDTSDVAEIKALGRKVKNYDDRVWSGMRQIIVYQGLMQKFWNNDQLRKKLLATKDDILAECAVQDRIWGIGLSMNDKRRLDMRQWQGQNLLGFALMQVRKALQ